MLDTNRLQPPRRFSPQRTPSPAREGTSFRADVGASREPRFISAEDFDATGILTGVDLCASSYWWMPELHTTAAAVAATSTLQATAHATARTSPRTTAAA